MDPATADGPPFDNTSRTGFRDDQLARIGELVVLCSNIEWNAYLAIELIAFPPDTSAEPVIGGESAGWIYDRLVRVAIELVEDDGLRTGWIAWVKDARALSEERNVVVHSTWARSNLGMVGRRMQRRGASRHKHFDEGEVQRLIEQAGKIAQQWGELIVATWRPRGAR